MACKYRKAVTIYDEYGKPKRVYVGSNDPAELDAKVTELKYMKNKGINISTDNITVKQLAEKWFSLNYNNKSYSTVSRVKRILKKYIYPKLGHIRIKNLKSYQVQGLINEMLNDGKTEITKKTLQVMKSMLTFGVNNDYILKNVANSISVPTFHAKEKKPLSKDERNIIEKSNNKYKDFFVLLLYTGLRKGEITALQWDDIDFENKTITVSKAVEFIHNQANTKSTKNGKTRIIPMLSKSCEILERRYKEKQSEYVFYKQDKNILSDIAIKRMVESFRKDTGLNFTLHQLRHTFCTILYYSGISLKQAQKIMGHSSVEITLNIYTHLDEEQETNTIEILDKYLEKI